MDLELEGKAALVTGGSRGLGKAIARELAREGVDVAICARDEGPLRATAEELSAETGRRVLPVQADMRDADAVRRLVQATVDAFGRIDILVNNAAQIGGTSGPEDLAHVTDELIINDFQTKMLGYVRCAREVAPHMRRQGWGRIINIGGMAGRMPKGVSSGMRNVAIANLAKALAEELGPHGTTVNAVHPGTIRSEALPPRLRAMADRLGTSVDAAEQRLAQENAIRRIVDAREIAYVVVFLCSPKAVSVSGEVVSTSGGAGPAVFY